MAQKQKIKGETFINNKISQSRKTIGNKNTIGSTIRAAKGNIFINSNINLEISQGFAFSLSEQIHFLEGELKASRLINSKLIRLLKLQSGRLIEKEREIKMLSERVK